MIKLKGLLNEGPQKVGNVNAFGASKVLGKGKKVLGFVPDTPNAVATLIQDYPQAMEIEFKQGFVYKGENHKSIKRGSGIWKELEKRFLDTATKDTMKAGFKMNENKPSVNEKSDDVFSDYSSSKGKTKGRSFSVDRAVKDGKYSFESDDRDGTVRLSYNGNPISYGFNDWSTGGVIMIHSSWKNKEKPFLFPEDVIKYFKSKRITTEVVTESVADIKSFRNKENDSWNDTMIKLVLMRKIDGKTAVYRLEMDNWFRRFENPGKGYGIMIRGIKIAPNPVKVSPNLVFGPNQAVLKAIITYLPNEFTSVDDDVKENYETAKGFIVLGNKNFTGFEMLQTLNPKDLELFIKSNIDTYKP